MRAHLLIRKEPYYRRNAFEQGLSKVGFRLIAMSKPEGPEDWLVLWNKQHSDEQLADRWEQQGGTVIVTENAYLQKIDKSTYAISVHGHNGSGWFPVGGEDRFTKIGIPMRPWNVTPVDGYRLICAQRGIGSKLMASPRQWAERLAERFARSKIPFKVRPHPGNFAPKTPLEQDLRKAVGCEVWSSAAGVRALVEGIPTNHAAPRWICAGGGDSDVARQLALHHMSHGQWRWEEIETGEPFARIIANRSKAKW